MVESGATLYRLRDFMPVCISVNRYGTMAALHMDGPWIPTIKRLMAGKNWNQRQLADISGVRRNTVSDLLNGTNSQIDTFAALAKALEVPLWALFCNEHEYALFSERIKQEDATALRKQTVRDAVHAEVTPVLEALIAKLSGETVPEPTRPVVVKRVRKKSA